MVSGRRCKRGAIGNAVEESDQAAFPAGEIAGSTRQAKPRAPIILPIAAKRDQGGVDVAFAADRRRIAQRLRHRLQHLLQGDMAGRQRFERDGGGTPGAEMLGGEGRAHRIGNIGVDVAGGDRPRLSIFVHILEEMLARQILHLPHEAQQAGVGDGQLLLLARFGAVAQRQRLAGQIDMAAAQRGGAETLVGGGIMFVAHAQLGEVQQADDGGQSAVLAQAAFRQVGLQPFAQFG